MLLFQGDLENYTEDMDTLLNLIDNKNLTDQEQLQQVHQLFPTSESRRTGPQKHKGESHITDIPAQKFTKYTEAYVMDHDYTRRKSPLGSDSGFSSDNPVSPQYSDTTVEAADSPYSGGSSPMNNMSDDQQEQLSPLGMGYEDVDISDIKFDTLDPLSFLQDGDLMNNLGGDSNFTLNLEGKCNSITKNLLKECL